MHPELGALCDSVLSISPAVSSDLIGSLNVSVATGGSLIFHVLVPGFAGLFGYAYASAYT